MIKENLTLRELEEYAQNNGYDSQKFVVNLNGKFHFCGTFLDAYYGFIRCPLLGDGMTRIYEIVDSLGERNVSFDIPDNNEYNAMNALQFILRGKDIPKEVSGAFNADDE